MHCNVTNMMIKLKVYIERWVQPEQPCPLWEQGASPGFKEVQFFKIYIESQWLSYLTYKMLSFGLPDTGGLAHGVPWKVEAARCCSPVKVKVEVKVNVKVKSFPLPLSRPAPWTHPVHAHEHDIHVAILKNHPYRPLLQLFRGGFSLHPGVSEPPHEGGGGVSPSRRATNLWVAKS